MKRTMLASAVFLLSTVAALAQPCNPSTTALCLSASRFEVKVTWTDFQNNTGDGQAIPLTADTGYFWFFTNTNVELVIKVLDARAINGHFWVFYGALSNVQYEITVRDSQTGDVQVYDNPSGQFASVGDTLAFPPSAAATQSFTESRMAAPAGRPADETRVAPAVWNSASACTPTPTALCLSAGRFQVEAAWKDFQGNTGVGQAVGLTGDTGYFWFFSSTNVEAVIKVLDARPVNNYFWVFYGALSNVQYTLTVTDTVTGIVKVYSNASGLFASVGDTQAFGAPTTFQLIEGAVVKGEITDETALLYKVYALFGDPRLPQAYVGTPPGPEEHGLMSDVVYRWSSLSAPTQQLLDPFLTPPIYPGSWFASGSASKTLAPRGAQDEWTKIPTARSWVWYRAVDAGAEAAANNVAAEIENVWDKETNLMQHDPITDADKTNNGGDGKLDIYLLPSFRGEDPNRPPEGITKPYRDVLDWLPGPPPNIQRAGYILIRISAASTPEGARGVVAHEFFHILALTYKYKDGSLAYHWLNEATATWMEDYVYQTNNSEHAWDGWYFQDEWDHPLSKSTREGYDEYLFFFYVARAFTPVVNEEIWSNVDRMSSVQAIDAGIPGGFAARWPEFALYCWNQPDVDQFKQWDGVPVGLNPHTANPYIELQSGNGTRTLPSRSVDPLAMSYVYVNVKNDAIKRIEIQNQEPTAQSGTPKTQAWIKLADGTTRHEDWTEKPRPVFCRDKASENVVELLILYTNSGPDDNGAPIVWDDGKIVYDSIGCGGFDGTVHETGHPGNGLNETIDVTASFRLVSPDQTTLTEYYAAQFTVRYFLTGTLGSCTVTMGPITRTFSFDSSTAGQSSLVIDKSVTPAAYYAEGDWALQGNQTTACPDGTTTVLSAVSFQWLKIPQGQFTVNNDGSLSGTYTDSLGRTWTWNFKPNQDQ